MNRKFCSPMLLLLVILGGFPLKAALGQSGPGRGYAKIPRGAYSIIAEIHAKPGKREELRAATLPLIALVRSDPKNLVYFFQAQYSTLLAQQATLSDVRMRGLPAHVESHLTRKLGVSELASFVAMSPRTFARQFEANFNTTPARWVRSLRVEAARQHLESRNLSLKEIARVTGFRDEQALRRAFEDQLKMNPKEYRERFGPKA